MNIAPLANSVSVAMLNKLLRVLGEQDVTPSDLRAVIEDKQFRAEVAELLRRGPQKPEYPLLTSIEYEAARRLISEMNGKSFDFSTDAMWGLADAINHMDGRDRDILRLYYGLDTGTRLTYHEVGQIHGISGTRTRQIAQRAISRLRHVEHIGRILMEQAVEHPYINEIGLGDQTVRLLTKVGLYSVKDLVKVNEDMLMAITNFNRKHLNEVKAALHERGLSLRDG